MIPAVFIDANVPSYAALSLKPTITEGRWLTVRLEPSPGFNPISVLPGPRRVIAPNGSIPERVHLLNPSG